MANEELQSEIETRKISDRERCRADVMYYQGDIISLWHYLSDLLYRHDEDDLFRAISSVPHLVHLLLRDIECRVLMASLTEPPLRNTFKMEDVVKTLTRIIGHPNIDPHIKARALAMRVVEKCDWNTNDVRNLNGKPASEDVKQGCLAGALDALEIARKNKVFNLAFYYLVVYIVRDGLGRPDPETWSKVASYAKSVTVRDDLYFALVYMNSRVGKAIQAPVNGSVIQECLREVSEYGRSCGEWGKLLAEVAERTWKPIFDSPNIKESFEAGGQLISPMVNIANWEKVKADLMYYNGYVLTLWGYLAQLFYRNHDTDIFSISAISTSPRLTFLLLRFIECSLFIRDSTTDAMRLPLYPLLEKLGRIIEAPSVPPELRARAMALLLLEQYQIRDKEVSDVWGNKMDEAGKAKLLVLSREAIDTMNGVKGQSKVLVYLARIRVEWGTSGIKDGTWDALMAEETLFDRDDLYGTCWFFAYMTKYALDYQDRSALKKIITAIHLAQEAAAGEWDRIFRRVLGALPTWTLYRECERELGNVATRSLATPSARQQAQSLDQLLAQELMASLNLR